MITPSSADGPDEPDVHTLAYSSITEEQVRALAFDTIRLLHYTSRETYAQYMTGDDNFVFAREDRLHALSRRHIRQPTGDDYGSTGSAARRDSVPP